MAFNLRSIFAGVALGLLTSTAVSAATVSLSAAKDAHAQGGASANTTFGGSSVLQVKAGADANFRRKTWTAFDVSGTSGQFSSADVSWTINGPLGVENTNSTWSFNVYGLNDGLDGWGENTLTWNNAPGNNTGTDGVLAGSVFGGAPLGSFDITGFGTSGTEVGITGGEGSALVDFLNADTDGLVSFILVRTTTEFSGQTVVHQFFSRTSTAGAGPNLTVVEFIPEPATASLLVLGGLAMLRRRRAV